jgi:hypothetical protein
VLRSFANTFLVVAAWGQSPSSFRDDFNLPVLDPAWIVKPGTIGQISLTAHPGFLRYQLAGTDPNSNPNYDQNGLWVYRPFSGDSWVLETKVTYSLSLAENGRQMVLRVPFGGLAGRNTNEVRWWRDIDCCGPRNRIVVDFYDNGQLFAAPDLPINAADTYVVRIIRRQQALEVQWSSDGTTFSSAGLHAYTTPLPASQLVLFSAANFCCTGYADYDYVSVSSGCQVNACSAGQTDNCVRVFTGTPSAEYIQAQFKAPNSMTVHDFAMTCGFDHFNWQNRITHNPPAPFGSTIQPKTPGPLIASGNVAYFGTLASPGDGHCVSDWIGCSLKAPPTYFDPPAGSYKYLSYNPYPYYLPNNFLVPGFACPVPGFCPPLPYAVSSDGIALSFADAPAEDQLSGEPASANPHGNFIAFSTTLVGVDNIGGSQPLYSWTWNSTFNGTAGGASQTASAHPIDIGSGTGGITITSLNGTPQMPPTLSCTAMPNTLWPPNAKSILVTVSGGVVPGTQDIPSAGTTYTVIDEYGQVQPRGTIVLSAGGMYSFGISLVAARNGGDQDGRTYTVVVRAKDAIGNTGSCSTVIVVPHDQGN